MVKDTSYDVKIDTWTQRALNTLIGLENLKKVCQSNGQLKRVENISKTIEFVSRFLTNDCILFNQTVDDFDKANIETGALINFRIESDK